MFDHIYLTGFKKFGNHEVNPTEEVVKAMSELGLQGLTCNILEVTTVNVDQYIDRIAKEVADRKDKKVLHLHFGVGPYIVYKLESHSYNNKNFGIPDNIGYQPINEKISPDLDLESPLKTNVDVVSLLSSVNQEGFASEPSTNPGRYLCNYVYFRSLYDLSQRNNDNSSLFIHFPTHLFSPHEKNVAFVKHLLKVLLKQTNLTVHE